MPASCAEILTRMWRYWAGVCVRSGVTDIHEGNWAVTAIKCTVTSAPASHGVTLTTQLDGLHFVYSSDVRLLGCWYL